MARQRPPTFSQDLQDVLGGPLIHQLATDLSALFPRRRRHPIGMHLGYLALQRAIGSGNRLDAELAATGVWQRAVAAFNHGATLHGDGRTIGAHLPPLTANTFRHARNHLTTDEHLTVLLAALSNRSVALAIDVGLLDSKGGSLTHPAPTRTLYGDGTIVRPLYRPDTPGRTDPDIAEHYRHDGPHWGNNFVLAYCRGPAHHQRIILGAARVDQPGREADTAVELFRSIVQRAGGRVQAIAYDGAFRGVHHNTLMRELGVVVITKVHAAARRDNQKLVRTIPLDTRHHTVDGHRCSHTLVINDGAIREAIIDAAGELRQSEPLARKQVRRNRSQRNGYRFTLGVTVACQREPFTAWVSIHPHADQLRLIPECDPDFAKLYGLRNDAESNNHSYKSTLPGRRAAALGWQRQLLDAAGWAILINARAHARYGTSQPPPAQEPVSAGALEQLLGPVTIEPTTVVSSPPAVHFGASRLMRLVTRRLDALVRRRAQVAKAVAMVRTDRGEQRFTSSS